VAAGRDDPGDEAGYAAVAIGHLHVGRFADDDRRRTRHMRQQSFDQWRRAQAAHFLVVAERDVDRHAELLRRKKRHARQHRRDEALHVGRTAAVKAAVPLGESERIARPRLAPDGDDIGMPGQHHSPRSRRADAGEKSSLVAAIDPPRPHAVRPQVGLDRLDQRQVGAG
jgi:hypothetical protein